LLRNELRSLPGVQLVTREEDPQLYLRVLVACVPSCRNIDNYTLAVVLSSPTSSMLGAQLAVDVLSSSATENVLVAADSVISAAVSGTARVHQLWTFGWPRQRYELATREFVRTLDAECIEKLRLISQSVAASLGGDRTGPRAAMRSLEG